MATTDPRPYTVQVGVRRYTRTYEFARLSQAAFHYECVNVHSGGRKRLLDQNGKVIRRSIT